MKRYITKPLIQADVIDAYGDLFTREALKEMVEKVHKDMDAGKGLWCHKNFSSKIEDVQGVVTGLSMGTTMVNAEVKIFDTPAGKTVSDLLGLVGGDALELVAAGTFDRRDVTERRIRTWWKPWTWFNPKIVRVINRVEITSVSFVATGTKIR